MRYIDISFSSPAENLACDEVLLNLAEEGKSESIIRFWQSSQYFVVLGSANKSLREVDIKKCKEMNIPVLRRASGGGTVLQGIGCVNYCVILPISSAPTIEQANNLVLSRNKIALERLLKVEVEHLGHTDLAIKGKKFSGNSQRRRRNYFLFHGTFLLNFDIPLIEKILPMPSKQPDYRKDRKHQDFLMNLNLREEDLKESLKTVWQANEEFDFDYTEEMKSLVSEKYSLAEWNLKF